MVNIIFALPFFVACVRELYIPVAILDSFKASVSSSFSRQMSVVFLQAQAFDFSYSEQPTRWRQCTLRIRIKVQKT